MEYFRSQAIGGPAQQRHLDEMDKQIKTYDGIAVTENATLSIVLTEKNMICQKYHIQLLPMVDGAAIDFMDPQDIYPLFSNMIDNAIECLRQVADEEKRVINLSVTRKGGLVSIACSNYCQEQPGFSDGLPITSKQDSTRHGFGVKSIRYLVQKYGGNVAFDWANCRFNVFILFAGLKA